MASRTTLRAADTPKQPAQIEIGGNVGPAIARQQDAVLRQEYDALGKVDFIFTTRGKIDFRKGGPMIGRIKESDELVLITNWPGLPDVDETRATKVRGANTEIVVQAPCSACETTCDECKGKGTRSCTVCGGSGSRSTLKKFCPAAGCSKETGEFNPDCKTCRGAGQVPDLKPCEGCKAGIAACGLCQGLGVRSTGTKGGSLDRNAPTCQKCNGNGRITKTRPQSWETFMHGRLGGLIVLGPIERIMWHTPGENSRFDGCLIQPDGSGNLMVLLLESAMPGARQYLVGGVPVMRAM